MEIEQGEHKQEQKPFEEHCDYGQEDDDIEEESEEEGEKEMQKDVEHSVELLVKYTQEVN